LLLNPPLRLPLWKRGVRGISISHFEKGGIEGDFCSCKVYFAIILGYIKSLFFSTLIK